MTVLVNQVLGSWLSVLQLFWLLPLLLLQFLAIVGWVVIVIDHHLALMILVV